MLTLKTILHPTDFSEAAMQSLEFAHSLARDHGARLVILSVATPILPNPEVYVAVDEINELLEKDRKRVARLASTITDVPVEHVARHGAPGPSIVDFADQLPASLIVMGTAGRTGLSRLLLGSVAEYVMRHAKCPVVTIKPGATDRVPVDDPAEQNVPA